ncbi:hypothetical protein HBA55_17480 [Pseudomaricurvus alkylphenolicus]|jgi:hypothetical protein|uniref:hypothetical protein n=1 Tax=Pseudomaricurvus alkylphenolicus TaxID=1306991 RepID=UPI00141E3CFC|nr:hypothetical protein [Pseudomaricurvus alkylphenolicus]NIB41399.1 hypothetical protein [Pseudomaricurvus alkylphenolicus]
MNNTNERHQHLVRRYQTLLFAHGSAVLLIGLIAALLLVFSMAGGVIAWPLLDIPTDIPGTVRGWKSTHVGGLTNGLLMIAMAIILTQVPMSARLTQFVYWSFVLTGWGNTVFYWAANFSANRGVSFHSNQYGESDLAGILAYLSGGSVMLLTIFATAVVMVASFRKARNLSISGCAD